MEKTIDDLHKCSTSTSDYLFIKNCTIKCKPKFKPKGKLKFTQAITESIDLWAIYPFKDRQLFRIGDIFTQKSNLDNGLHRTYSCQITKSGKHVFAFAKGYNKPSEYRQLTSFLNDNCIEHNVNQNCLTMMVPSTVYVTIKLGCVFDYVTGTYETSLQFSVDPKINSIKLLLMIEKRLERPVKQIFCKGIIMKIIKYIDPNIKTVVCDKGRLCDDILGCPMYHCKSDIMWVTMRANFYEVDEYEPWGSWF